jgi:hypothetical protein
VPVAADLFETGDGLVNLVAAMPSLHAAYPAMLLLFFWGDGRWWRVGLVVYTLAMGFTLVYGGEHFVTDVLVGWAYAVIAFTLVCVAWPAWWRARARRARLRVGDLAGRVAQGLDGGVQRPEHPVGAQVGEHSGAHDHGPDGTVDLGEGQVHAGGP